MPGVATTPAAPQKLKAKVDLQLRIALKQ